VERRGPRLLVSCEGEGGRHAASTIWASSRLAESASTAFLPSVAEVNGRSCPCSECRSCGSQVCRRQRWTARRASLRRRLPVTHLICCTLAKDRWRNEEVRIDVYATEMHRCQTRFCACRMSGTRRAALVALVSLEGPSVSDIGLKKPVRNARGRPNGQESIRRKARSVFELGLKQEYVICDLFTWVDRENFRRPNPSWLLFLASRRSSIGREPSSSPIAGTDSQLS
jgi:hypothetical protein